MGRLGFRSALLIILSMGALILGPSCGEKSTDTEQYLEFNSGGRYHPSGYGQWRVRLCPDGSVVADHDIGDRSESSDVFIPTALESRKLFSLFCAVDIKRMKSPDRPGVPDEVLYSFVLKDGSGNYTTSMWINDARENPAIVELVAYLEQLIEKYTGKRPVMR